jgi:hypothetical protein
VVLKQMLTQARQQDDARVAEWENERLGLERDLLRGQSEVCKLLAEIGSGESSGGAVTRLAELQAFSPGSIEDAASTTASKLT